MFKVSLLVSLKSSWAKYPCVNWRNLGLIELFELNANSVAPVTRLATGQPPFGSASEAVWSLRKLNEPPGSINWITLKTPQRQSPPNLNECRPCTHETKSLPSRGLSLIRSVKNDEPIF